MGCLASMAYRASSKIPGMSPWNPCRLGQTDPNRELLPFQAAGQNQGRSSSMAIQGELQQNPACAGRKNYTANRHGRWPSLLRDKIPAGFRTQATEFKQIEHRDLMDRFKTSAVGRRSVPCHSRLRASEIGQGEQDAHVGLALGSSQTHCSAGGNREWHWFSQPNF